MPVKQWIKELGEFRILHCRNTHKGQVEDFKVLLLALIEEEWVCITRYDCAHGFAHQDIIGKNSDLREKVVYPNVTKRDLFRHAIIDCYENREHYRQDFLAH